MLYNLLKCGIDEIKEVSKKMYNGEGGQYGVTSIN